MSVQLGVRTRKFNYHSQHSSQPRNNLPALNYSSGKVNDVKCCQKLHRRLQFWNFIKKLSKFPARLQPLTKELGNEINLRTAGLIDRQIDCGVVIKWIVLTIGKLIHQTREMQSIEKHACRFSQLSTTKSIYFRLDFFGKYFSLESSRRLVPNESDFLAGKARIAINKWNNSMFLKKQPSL